MLKFYAQRSEVIKTMLQSLKTFGLSVAVGLLFAAPFIVEIAKELTK